jgi:hypothetical protein
MSESPLPPYFPCQSNNGERWRKCYMFGRRYVEKEEVFVAGIVRHARLESPASRRRLKRGRQAHWQAIVEGKIHIGWQCLEGARNGRWVLRRYLGNRRYSIVPLGRADDTLPADGMRVLDFDQALSRARAMVDIPVGKSSASRYVKPSSSTATTSVTWGSRSPTLKVELAFTSFPLSATSSLPI